MTGMDAATGRALAGDDHLRQSVADLLRTRLGERVMRRRYGSRLLDLVDGPLNRGTLVRLYAATAEALARWEPRIRVLRLRATPAVGAVTLDLEAVRIDRGTPAAVPGLVTSTTGPPRSVPGLVIRDDRGAPVAVRAVVPRPNPA